MPTGNLTFLIRHAGQYYDQEVNLFYNYFRDYNPITGRYVESDPIGLDGGLNTYGYVGGNALSLVDPKGLAMLFPAIGLGETVNLGLAISLIYNMPDTDSTP
ncbi:RHS repeat-associated core domain-containing protein [Acinetobacter bouvetii]|uniref:Deoxyribonuclease RhsC n=1 Tax=Acinetobacter bouvetii TaxID=202951 RepID=A0A811GFI4_9GAMM|nr:RHS repeat-associated core domain-containing protein [Acinetobacter bouvetii]CAB1223449.1 Putative deoxyribonuclease RhsC [Acinetobacter bouvetii]